jgi:GNAT superfamily N-acetyltransferase
VRRIIAGRCFIALDDDKIIGTITCYLPDPNKSDWPLIYKAEGVAHFGQFAVEPTYQGEGLGSRLLFQAEEQAILAGMHTMSLDTAEGVPELIAYYEKKGYKPVEFHQWHTANYRSIILAKKLVI